MKRKNIMIGSNVNFVGYPIISTSDNAMIIIGDKSVFVSDCKKASLGTNHPMVIRASDKDTVIRIGNHARMTSATIRARVGITIGDNICVGANALIVDSDFHSLDPLLRASENDSKCAISKPVTIGNDVFLGSSCMILKGVNIGNAVIVGAGAIVVKDIPDYAIVAGNPAKIVSYVQPK